MFVKQISAILLTGCFAIGTTAQDDQEPKTQKIAAMTNVTLQMVRTDGTKILLVHDVPDRTKERVTQTYTVMVPVQKTVVKDGKPVVVTSYVKETRTRMVVPTVQKAIPVSAGQVFKDRDGKALSKNEVIGKLGMGNGRYVVAVQPLQKVSPQLLKLFSKDTLFLHYKVEKTD